MKQRPIILGIVGDSAAGKTTITGGLMKLLGADRVTHVCADDYHKYDRHERKMLNITALHPDCNYLDILELHLERLHYGQPILKPVYDHSTGSLVRPEYIQPREFVIVEGLLGFTTATMRQFYDVKVYLNPPEDLRRVWKIKRDTTKRGYTAAEVLAELEKREPDSRDFIRTQRQYADIVVHFHADAGVPPEQAGPQLNAQLTLRPASNVRIGRNAPGEEVASEVAAISGSALGVIIDARGRPLRLAEEPAGRQKQLWDWLVGIGAAQGPLPYPVAELIPSPPISVATAGPSITFTDSSAPAVPTTPPGQVSLDNDLAKLRQSIEEPKKRGFMRRK